MNNMPLICGGMEVNMRKHIISKNCSTVVVMSAVVLVLAGCGKAQQTETTTQGAGYTIYKSDSAAASVKNEKSDKLVAEDLSSWNLDYTDSMDMEAIVHGAGGTDEEKLAYDELRLFVNSYAAGSFEGSDGCYMTSVPLRMYNLNSERIAGYQVLLFDKDMTKCTSVFLSRMSGLGGNEISMTGMDFYMLDSFKADTKAELLYLSLNSDEFVLDSDNNVSPSLMNTRHSVSGDYYHVLDYELLAVSYDELTSNDSLVWFEFMDENEAKALQADVDSRQPDVNVMSREEIAQKYDVYSTALNLRFDPEEYLDKVVEWCRGDRTGNPADGMRMYNEDAYAEYMTKTYGAGWQEKYGK